mgnify:CR=1 FL=1
MTRPVPEWIGKTDATAIPARVRVRVFQSQDGCCAECGKKMAVCGEPFEIDHTTALVNGGENRESNLRALCGPCHKSKTRADVAEKSTVARKRRKHLGNRTTRQSLPGSRDSKWKRKIDGTVERRKDA